MFKTTGGASAQKPGMTETLSYTPALGVAGRTQDYDRVIAVMTRERKWRGRLLAAVAPAAGDTIVDLGCGTGTLAIMLARAASPIRVLGLDPDPDILAIAAAKAAAAEASVEFVRALAGDRTASLPDGVADKVVTSLVLHQCSLAAKRALLGHAHRLLRPAGTLLVADYGAQRTLLMQLLFNQVRSLDGYENTRANKEGRIPGMMAEAGFAAVTEHWAVQTPTGAITLWTGTKPP